MKCTKCKAELRIAQEQIGVNEQNLPILKTFAYCDKCKIRYDYDDLLKKQPKPYSALSVWALILSLLGCTSLIGGLLGIVDLCINDKSKKHTGSWFAIIFCALFILTGGTVLSCGGKTADDTASNNMQTSETVVSTTPSENVVETTTSEEISEVVSEDESVEVPTETEEEYKASCQEYNYKDVLRNPNNYVGQRIVIEMEISSVHSEDILTPVKYYFGHTKEEPDDTYYYGDFYAVFDKRYDTSLKLLDEDVVVVWGEISAPQETQSLIVNSEEVFCIDMKYAELIAE